MGYDINTVLGNQQMAETFAKDYGYTHLFNNETGAFEGGDRPYFRANIWSMGNIRNIIVELYKQSGNTDDRRLVEMLDKMSWNDGNVVSAKDCEWIISMYNGDKVRDIAYAIVAHRAVEEPDFLTGMRPKPGSPGEWEKHTYSQHEIADGYVQMFDEFISYCHIAKQLDGFEVW